MTRQYLLLSLVALAACSSGDDSKTKVEGGDSGNGEPTTCTDGPATSYFSDTDGDGYGNAEDSRELCGAEAGWVTNDLDCNDGDSNISPEGDEVCDDVDNDCDGVIDNDSALDARDWYHDSDGDEFGAGPPLSHGCTGLEGQTSEHGDCDDSDPSINPEAVEVCDDVDNDCDSDIDEGETPDGNAVYEDIDEDGFGDPATLAYSCETPAGWVTNSDDCDDTDDTFNPDATDACDGYDQDCDGHINSRCGTDLPETDGYKVTVDDVAGPAGMVVRDLNGDDAADLLVFVPMLNKAQVFAGPIDTDRDTPTEELTTSEASTLLGVAVRSEVDFDGDGLPDLLVSAPVLDSSTGDASTSVRLFTGSLDLTLDLDAPDVELSSGPASEYLGFWSMPAGELTGDGSMDVVLRDSEGSVYLWDNTSEDSFVSSSSPRGSYPEMSLAMTPAIGDLNADGQDDMVIPAGADLYSFTGPLDPELWMMTADSLWTGAIGSTLGEGLCSGDLTGDGLNDLAYTETNADDAGGAGNKIQIESFEDDEFGPSWSHVEPFVDGSVGLRCTDLDGDGQHDLLIFNFTESSTESLAGRTSLFFGPIRPGTIDEEPDRVILGTTPMGFLGFTSAIGDLTNDGVDDLALGTLDTHLRVFDVGAWTSETWESADR